MKWRPHNVRALLATNGRQGHHRHSWMAVHEVCLRSPQALLRCRECGDRRPPHCSRDWFYPTLQAALYALSPQDAQEPISVVSAAPYYSAYPALVDCLKSGIHKWAGDAAKFNKDGPFIELITSPNNPDGYNRGPAVHRTGGKLFHDLAYYWPQYAAISSSADHEIMLFTVSKSTGHAGMRIGLGITYSHVARKMVKFIELSTIGVSKDSQLRAASVLKVVSDSCEHPGPASNQSLFDEVHNLMATRWSRLRGAVKQSVLFTLPDFSPAFCKFRGQYFEPQPAFAWLKCEEPIEDCQVFLRKYKILTRSLRQFGVGPQ
ncbi:Tryptophan aminotransferase- protein 2, partial [Turnera subulata]